jgi:hypothetical protein
MRVRVIVSSILVALGPGISGQTLKFERAAILGPEIPDFAVPRQPVFADFNRDGQTDLVVGSDKSVWLFLNRGGGQFLPPVAVGDFGPYDAGDLNSDGTPDILLGGASTRVLFGAGDGTFPHAVDIGPASQTVHLADINGDHRPDLVVRTKDSLLVYLSNGDGTFQTPVETPVSTATYGSLIGDFDSDGVPDVLLPPAAQEILAAGIPYTSLPDRFEILAGKGDGTFRRLSTSLVYTGPLTGIVVADFNGDKISDVAFGDKVAIGDGSGYFRPPVVLPYCCLTAAADVNGDGILDLFAYQPYDSYYSSGFTLVMFGKGDGTFGDAPSAKFISGPLAVAEGELAILGAAALAGDSVADFVAGRTSDGGSIGGLWARLGNGDGTFRSAQKIGPTRSFAAMETADFNSDGKRDLAVADSGDSRIRLYLGRGDGSFEPALSYDVGAPPFELAWQDFNGDGIHDLAVLTRTGGPLVDSIPLLFGGPHGFVPEQGRIIFPEPIFISVLGHADFNGDVQLDLVGASPDLWVGLGNGDGTFRQVRFPVSHPWIVPPLRVGFLDRDSKDDILTVGQGGQNAQELLIFLSNGDGTFRRSPGYWFVGGIVGLAAADFTADGIIDVVVTNFFAMYFLRGRGDGTFDPPVAFVLQANQPDQQQVIASVDFNRDGKRDLFTCGSFCSIRLGNGDGTFQMSQRLDFGQAGYHFLLADFDNNGLPDIAVMDSGRVELFLNRSR